MANCKLLVANFTVGVYVMLDAEENNDSKLMPLTIGAHLGSYEIQGALGAGGMGEVYRARDAKLGRSVAIKVLPDAVANDPERTARFDREARVLASLNHPHIAALFGMEEAVHDSRRQAIRFLVMELVDGETLAERIARGPLAIEDALLIALQITEALEAAHEAGIIHRDLKPANVKIARDENVKVLDFGLARALDPSSRGDTGSKDAAYVNSPTLSVLATQAGVILGTAAYMSPEQAKGLQADARSDVFAFGVVLYEMLTGRQPFQGETAPEVMAAVLVREPDLASLPVALNPRVHDLIRRCLEKNPRKRWQAVGDLRAEIEAVRARPRSASTIATVVVQSSKKKIALAAALGAIAVAALTGAAMWALRPAPPAAVVTRFPITLAEGQQFTSTSRNTLAISPDGTKIAYVANARLYVRSMRELEARPLSGTENLSMNTPVFSPDGRSIAFQAQSDNTLKRIDVNGGVPITICPAAPLFGMSWSRDAIVFGQPTGIMKVSSNGGKPELVVPTKGGQAVHGPQLIGDGQTILFTLATGTNNDRWDKASIVAQSLRTGDRKVLFEGGSDARYLPTGHIVYAVGGSLFAVRFDVRRLETIGGPTPIVEGVTRVVGRVANIQAIDPAPPRFSVSDNGSLIYVPGPVTFSGGQRDLAFIDRSGHAVPLKLSPGPYEAPRLSPDGSRVAFGSDDSKEANVWIYQLSGSDAMRKLTLDGANRFPIWADNQRVAFQSDREGDRGIFWKRADGEGGIDRLTKPEPGTSHVPESWSPNGETLLFAVEKDGEVVLWTLSLRDKKLERFGDVKSRAAMDPIFSPDGHWVAYDSAEGAPGSSSRVYVEPFPRTGTRHQVTKETGMNPLWLNDGKELVYTPGPVRFSAITISTRPGFSFGSPTTVPRAPLLSFPPNARRSYDSAPKDGRIIGVIDASQAQSGVSTAPVMQVVLNWFEELKARVP